MFPNVVYSQFVIFQKYNIRNNKLSNTFYVSSFYIWYALDNIFYTLN